MSKDTLDCSDLDNYMGKPMQPARMAQTDAVFNIGFAWGVLQTLGPGVYIAMNGRVFEAGHVRKNRDAGRFEPA